VLDHLRWRGVINTFVFHPANGGTRTAVEGAIFKSMGVIPGVPDLILIHAGSVFGLELKSKNGRVTETQMACHRRLRNAGARVAVAVGIDQAVQQLNAWGLLRPDVSNQSENPLSIASRLRSRQGARRAFAAKAEHNRRHES
jgi:hypothetical protein